MKIASIILYLGIDQGVLVQTKYRLGSMNATLSASVDSLERGVVIRLLTSPSAQDKEEVEPVDFILNVMLTGHQNCEERWIFSRKIAF